MSPPDGTTIVDGGAAASGGAAPSAGAAVSGGASSAVVSGGSSASSAGAAASGSVVSGGASSSGTVVSGGASSSGTASSSTSPWGDDWRQKMARGDEKALAHVGRYASPEAVYDALRAAQVKIDSGQLKNPLPENATPEQLTEYRKANGIPETADKYDTSLPNGLVIGEADKPVVDSFLKYAHDNNWTPAQVKQGLAFEFARQDQMRLQQEEKDATDKQDGTAKLGEMWPKGEAKRNVKVIEDYLKGLPGDLGSSLLVARLPNGKLLGNDPDALNWIYGEALFKNPIPSSIGGNSESQIKVAETRLGELTKMMGDKKSDYWKRGEVGAKLQQEFRDLSDGLAKVKAMKR